MAAVKRTFGWIQNPSSLCTLKKVVGIFQAGSDDNRELVKTKLPQLLQYALISKADYDVFVKELSKTDIFIDYVLLKGKGNEDRKAAICTGIIQAVIDGQQSKTYTDVFGHSTTIKKPYTDDWTAEGFLRWSIACGLIEYSKTDDKCRITPLGSKLASARHNSPEEHNVFAEALLLYPPVIRILSLLKAVDAQTKFNLGSKLGFKGELGFTSMPQEVYLCDYCEAQTSAAKSKVRSNEEGDSDKYARGIASWCIQMGWITSRTKEVTETYRGIAYTAKLQTYSITRNGEKALVKARGNSSNPRLPRVVMFEMLASNKAPGADYLRYVRALIMKTISPGWKSQGQIQKNLEGCGLKISFEAVKDHIRGLASIGLEIHEKNSKYKLADKIERLEIPPRSECIAPNTVKIKEQIRNKLTALDHKYLILVDLAYSDASTKAKKNADAREFEIQTADLFTKELSFCGQRLGGSKKPDVIISYGANGTIIDNKSYKDGFNISRSCADEMSRYINENILRDKVLNRNEWWKSFDQSITTFTFLFITSFLKGKFEEQLQYISDANGGIKGAAIGIESLLYFCEAVKTQRVSQNDFYKSFSNREIVFTV